MATKNNPRNRGRENVKKILNGKEIEPVLYVGIYAGHGKYMAAKYSKTTNVICDSDGRPIPWDEIISEV